MDAAESRSLATDQADRILPLTRIVAGMIVPVLVLAFIILYLAADTSGVRFAWEIKPHMTAMFMGAGYLGGAWLFSNAIFGRQWHRVAPGFLPVTAFTWAMLLVTLIHWGRFSLSHIPFLLWLVLYVATPFVVPALWLANRRADPGTPELHDAVVPGLPRLALMILGCVLLLTALMGLSSPATLISIWPWMLTPLTARVLGGWFALLGVGGLVIGREQRWSSWKVGIQSIGLWHALVLTAALRNPAEFPNGIVNWYVISVAVVLVGMLVLYIRMERIKT